MKLLGAVIALVAAWVVLQKLQGAQAGASPQSAAAGAQGESPAPAVAADAGNSISTAQQDAMDNLTQAIAQFEGFFVPGSISNRQNNPGDLENVGGGYQSFNDAGDGWDALVSWIQRHVAANPDWDFYDFFDYYLRGSTTAPSNDAQGNSDQYAEFVTNYLGVDPTSNVAQFLAG